MADTPSQDVLRYCDMLDSLAFDVFSSSQHAHHMAALEERGGVAFGVVAVHTQFAMSYSAYQSMKLYYLGNPVLKSDVIEAFLRSYAEFSRVFSGNWIASAGAGVIDERFACLEASYRALRSLLVATRERHRPSPLGT